MGTVLETNYAVAGNDVTLSIDIGEGQLGDSVVRLQGKDITPKDTAHIRNLPIGGGAKLTGQALGIKTIVSDVNDSTNKTSVRYRLEGGKTPGQYELRADVAEEGDAVVYHVTIHFV